MFNKYAPYGHITWVKWSLVRFVNYRFITTSTWHDSMVSLNTVDVLLWYHCIMVLVVKCACPRVSLGLNVTLSLMTLNTQKSPT